jgi:hypothetical protein
MQEVELSDKEFAEHRKSIVAKRLDETVEAEFQRIQLYHIFCRAIDTEDAELMKSCTIQETDIVRARNTHDAARRLDERVLQWFAENIEDSE